MGCNMIYYLMNDNKEIIKDDFSFFENALSMSDEDYKIVNGYNGALFLETFTKTEEYKQKEAEWQRNHILKVLKTRREQECFSIINRGYLWYLQLTDEHIRELNVWYDAWLDVTETLTVPKKPDWID